MKEEGIKIKRFSKKDKKRAKDFLDFSNLLAEEDLMLAENRKKTLTEEKKRLERKTKGIGEKKEVFLFVEQEGQIAGTVSVKLHTDAKSHIAEISGLTVGKEHRRKGIGKHLIKEAISAAKKELRYKPKALRLSVFANNVPAIRLYEKVGFRVVARIPKQLRYKKRLIDEVIMIKNIG